MTRGVVFVCSLTVSKEALAVLDSSETVFFPVKTFLRFFLTSLLKIRWKKKMNTPCERGAIRFIITRRSKKGADLYASVTRCATCRQLKTANR